MRGKVNGEKSAPVLTIENPFFIILTARRVNGKLTRPNWICVLNRLIK